MHLSYEHEACEDAKKHPSQDPNSLFLLSLLNKLESDETSAFLLTLPLRFKGATLASQ